MDDLRSRLANRVQLTSDGHKTCAAPILLAVEVADTSLAYDLGPKARLYAIHGAAELWS